MKSDLDLQRDVLAELKWEPGINAVHIGVSVNDGVVTLSGHVPSYSEEYAAEQATKRVYGVTAVAACAHALKFNTEVPDDKIRVVVSNGFVTLEGDVDWYYQTKAAEQAVWYLTCVAGASDLINVKPHASATDVTGKIEAAFKTIAEIDSRRVSVEAQDGRVTLRGHLRSWMERTEAQTGAWSAPGVAAVENQLLVTPLENSRNALRSEGRGPKGSDLHIRTYRVHHATERAVRRVLKERDLGIMR